MNKLAGLSNKNLISLIVGFHLKALRRVKSGFCLQKANSLELFAVNERERALRAAKKGEMPSTSVSGVQCFQSILNGLISFADQPFTTRSIRINPVAWPSMPHCVRYTPLAALLSPFSLNFGGQTEFAKHELASVCAISRNGQTMSELCGKMKRR